MKQIFLKLLPIAVNWGKNNLVVDVVEQKLFSKSLNGKTRTLLVFRYSEIFGFKFNRQDNELVTLQC